MYIQLKSVNINIIRIIINNYIIIYKQHPIIYYYMC